MGRVSGVSRRRKQKNNYNVKSIKRQKRKEKKKTKILCKPIKDAWDSKKSLTKNMSDMGLSVDPNITIPPPKYKDQLDPDKLKKKKVQKTKSPKEQVVKELEKEANVERKSSLRLPKDVVRFCVYMMEKYGEDYAAMAKDPKNYYQETPKQIRYRINLLKRIPEQWNAYLRAKEMASDEDSDENTSNTTP